MKAGTSPQGAGDWQAQERRREAPSGSGRVGQCRRSRGLPVRVSRVRSRSGGSMLSRSARSGSRTLTCDSYCRAGRKCWPQGLRFGQLTLRPAGAPGARPGRPRTPDRAPRASSPTMRRQASDARRAPPAAPGRRAGRHRGDNCSRYTIWRNLVVAGQSVS